jgi:hypothetical protein
MDQSMLTPPRRAGLRLGPRTAATALRACKPAYLLALLLACMTSESLARPVPSAQPAVSLEYAVKATYLYKLAPFVNWPPTEFTTATEPFRICVVGDDPFDDFLDKAVAGRRFGAHPFEVRRLDALTPEVDCQIAFISHLAPEGVRHALDAVSGKPVLTVTDSATADQGGIVQFVIRDGRVAFEIDTSAAARNHLTISSKLLHLAVAVKGEG